MAIAGLAVAGCGDDRRAAPGPAAPSPPDIEEFVSLTTAQAARRADRIAVVVSRGSRVVEAEPRTPFTRTRFAVERVIKGKLPREIVLQVIGGRIGNVLVPPAVQPFARSGRYILFLGPDGPAGPTIFPQSVLTVSHDVVQPTPDGLRLHGTHLDDVVSALRSAR
jgi:hypothetical protein